MNDGEHTAPARSAEIVAQLQRQMAVWASESRTGATGHVSSGWELLDQQLPDQGFRRGSLVEWLTEGDGAGAEALAWGAALEACQNGGAVVVFDRQQEFYPPAAIRLGADPDQLIVVQAAREADEAWAIDQAMRCHGVAAILVRVKTLDSHAFRRLQLAAESSGVLGLFLRPAAARREPSWADVRLMVEPLSGGETFDRRRLRLHLLRCRGGVCGRCLDVEFDDATRTLHLADELAPAAAPARAARA